MPIETDTPLHILLIDDDEVDRMAARRTLKATNINTTLQEATNSTEGFEAAQTNTYDCILLDYQLPDGDGLSLLRRLREAQINTPVIMMTGQGDEELAVEMLHAGANDYLPKGKLKPETLARSLNNATSLFKAETERKAMAEQQRLLIQELQEARDQLLQNEKMAAIGQLAAGVAHEINNPIGYINSNLGTLQRYTDDLINLVECYQQLESQLKMDQPELIQQSCALKKNIDLEYIKEDLPDLVRESQEGAERVRQIVQDLKEFSHVDEAEWQWVDLHHGLDSTLNIVRNELKYKAEIHKEYGDLPQVECLASQLNQVFMNLLVNAAHAIEKQGIITLRTGCDENEVWVKISDTGKGIPEKNLKRIFEPFYTTKAVGIGTGLGLSLSYSIIKKHHGHIDVVSEKNRGTQFTIHLPIQHPDKTTEANQ